MKKHIVILFMLLSIALTSCKYNDVFINPYDPNADTTEIQKICDRSEAECGYISEEYRNSIIELFCGECSDGLECCNNTCRDIDKCEDDLQDDNDNNDDTSVPDEDTDAYSADSMLDENNSNDDEDSTIFLPECSVTSETPCIDSSSGLIWSARMSSKMAWSDAKSYCESYSEGIFSDWYLPTISELRTLIINCSGTVTGGSCGVTDTCLSYSECRNDTCSGCDYDDNDYYSKLGDTGWFWSSSTKSDNPNNAWFVGFSNGYVDDGNKYYDYNVRCVRTKQF